MKIQVADVVQLADITAVFFLSLKSFFITSAAHAAPMAATKVFFRVTIAILALTLGPSMMGRFVKHLLFC